MTSHCDTRDEEEPDVLERIYDRVRFSEEAGFQHKVLVLLDHSTCRPTRQVHWRAAEASQGESDTRLKGIAGDNGNVIG